MRRIFVIGFVFVCAACSSSSGSPAATDATTDSAKDTATDSSSDAPLCWDDAGDWIVADKGCAVDGDCTTAPHTLDCCGTRVVVGIAKSKLAGFQTCESSWDGHFPGCGCPPGPTKTEDGKTVSDPSVAVVACVGAGSPGAVCTSRAP